MAALFLPVAALLIAGCASESSDDTAAQPVPALTGFHACEAPDEPVSAFWGSADGVGSPDDSEGAPSGGDIWAITADGRLEQLTDDARSRDPSISDDAQRLYFTRSDGGLSAGAAAPGTELWVRDLATGEESMLFATDERTQGVNAIEESPDGSALAFVASVGVPRTTRPLVYVLDLEAESDPMVVPLPPVAERYPFQWQAAPTWSPDGSRLAYVLVGSVDRGVQSSLRVVDLDAGEDTLLYQASSEVSYLRDLQWSPDGDRLLAVEHHGVFAAVSIDADTGERSRLAERTAGRVTFAGSDGEAIAAIGWTHEQINSPEPGDPVLTTWTNGEATSQELPMHLSFATQLTIADCSHDRAEGRPDDQRSR